MKNKILHALSNRTGPFVTPIFISDYSFIPDAIDDDQKTFRSKLFLNVTSTDYYLKLYLSLLHGFPDLERICEDYISTYTICDFNPRGVSIEGAEFLSVPNVVGRFTDKPVISLPVSLNYEVRYFSANYLNVFAIESGLSRRCSYAAIGDNPNKILRFDWQDFPFKGPLRLNQEWSPGARVSIVVEPSQFPYDLLWNNIRGDRWLNKQIAKENLTAAIMGTADVKERLAIALLMLVMGNNAIFGEALIETPSRVIETVVPSVWPTTLPLRMLTTSPLPQATVAEFYSFQFLATGGTGRYLWSIASGAVPDGMTFSSNGLLSGIPPVEELSTFSVTVTDY